MTQQEQDDLMARLRAASEAATRRMLDHIEETEPFRLSPVKPRPKQAVFDDNDKTRQRVLLDGLECLPGQQDLF